MYESQHEFLNANIDHLLRCNRMEPITRLDIVYATQYLRVLAPVELTHPQGWHTCRRPTNFSA